MARSEINGFTSNSISFSRLQLVSRNNEEDIWHSCHVAGCDDLPIMPPSSPYIGFSVSTILAAPLCCNALAWPFLSYVGCIVSAMSPSAESGYWGNLGRTCVDKFRRATSQSEDLPRNTMSAYIKQCQTQRTCLFRNITNQLTSSENSKVTRVPQSPQWWNLQF